MHVSGIAALVGGVCLFLGLISMGIAWNSYDDTAETLAYVLFFIAIVAACIMIAAIISENPGKPHAANEFCRHDTVGKVSYETCITPVSPALVPLYITPTTER